MPGWLQDLLEIVKWVLGYIDKVDAAKPEKAVQDVIDRREESKSEDRPPKGSWDGLKVHLLGAFFLVDCAGHHSTSIVERRIYWPQTMTCPAWTLPKGFSGSGPMLLGIEGMNDIPLSEGNGQSCFSVSDVTRIESELAGCKEKVKQCLPSH